MAIHIAGFVSGNDYQSMVDQLLAAKRIPIDAKQTQMDELDYDLGAWSSLSDLSQELTESLDTLRGYELWRNMTVNSTDETTVTATAVTSAAEQTYNMVITDLATAQSVSSDLLDTTTDLISMGYANEGDIINIEGQDITFDAAETLATLRAKINNASDDMAEEDRVIATIIDNRLVITREQTGAASVSISDVSGLALETMGILNGGLIKNENVEGTDAHFSINGLDVVRSNNRELDDVVDGLTLNLYDSGTSTLTVEHDREAVKEAILDFVEKYNIFAEQVDQHASIQLGSSSELAQKGELYGDVLLNSIERTIRQQATDLKSPTLNQLNAGYTDNGVDNIMDSLSDIGVWTSGEANELTLDDEDRLDERLDYDFDLVAQLFRGIYDSEQVAYTGGIASDFYRYMSRVSESLTGDIAKRIETMTGKYDDLADEIKLLEADLDDYEQEQWEYFTVMEDALAEMESQLSYVSSVFGGGSKD